MRRRLICAPMMIICLVLAGCTQGAEAEADELAVTIRGEYLSMRSCSGEMELTADYGQRVYEYTVDFSYQADGDTVLTVTEPENLAGISVRIQDGGTGLEFEGIQLETGPLDGKGLSPVEAFPALLRTVQEGYIAQAGLETTQEERKLLRIDCRDPAQTPGSGIEYSVWLDAQTHALVCGEVANDGYTVIACELTKFEWE